MKENVAGEGRVNESAKSVVFASGLIEDELEVGSVAEAQVASHPIAQDLGGKSAGQHLGLAQVDFPPGKERVEGLSIGSAPRGIDLG